MKIAYYPGCSLEGTAREYDLSLRAVAPLLGIELVEIDDWNCCGATAAHSLKHNLAVALPARNLALAEQAGYDAILAPCAACSQRLISVRHELAENEQLRQEIAGVIELPYSGKVRVLNILQLLEEIGEPAITAKLRNKINGRKIAAYYGCLLVRAPKVVQFDRPEDPQSMDRIMKMLGAEPVDWAFKTECCGGGFSVSRTDMVLKMTHDVLANAAAGGAEAIVVACPMCQSNLDLRQAAVNSSCQTSFHLPVLYLTQWLGLALGLSPLQLGLGSQYVDAGELIARSFTPLPVSVPGMTPAATVVAEPPR